MDIRRAFNCALRLGLRRAMLGPFLGKEAGRSRRTKPGHRYVAATSPISAVNHAESSHESVMRSAVTGETGHMWLIHARAPVRPVQPPSLHPATTLPPTPLACPLAPLPGPLAMPPKRHPHPRGVPSTRSLAYGVEWAPESLDKNPYVHENNYSLAP